LKRSAVIVAGGKGLRMQTSLPKQFLEINGTPVLIHTINRFHSAFTGDIAIVLVLPTDQMDYWKQLCAQHAFETPFTIVAGGETRFNSVKNGLSNCADSDVIGVHDGVRPLVSEELIRKCYEQAERGSAIPVTAVNQSMRKQIDGKTVAIDRSNLLNVQTPQCFQGKPLLAAYDSASHTNFTDDATVFEAAGHEIATIEGDATNIKITTPGDIKIAEALITLL